MYGQPPRDCYAQLQVEQIERAHGAGAHGLKVEKILGLYLRENIGGRIELCSELKLYRAQNRAPAIIRGRTLSNLLSISRDTTRVLWFCSCCAYSAAGRWGINGLGLPDDILHKMYSENAARLMGIELKIELK